jgi:type IV secretion system protein VirB4
MMNLAEYRHHSQSLADFLPWAALVEKGVILNKDGSFQRTARFRGPDLDSATTAELVAITGRLNNALRRLGSCWAIFIEAQRLPANRYPEGEFPMPPRVWSMRSAVRSSRKKAPISRADTF